MIGCGCLPGGPTGAAAARPGPPGCPVPDSRRVHPLAGATGHTCRVPPRDLFGTDRLALRGPLDAVVLVLSHSPPGDRRRARRNRRRSRRRMAASLVEERARVPGPLPPVPVRVPRAGRAPSWSRRGRGRATLLEQAFARASGRQGVPPSLRHRRARRRGAGPPHSQAPVPPHRPARAAVPVGQRVTTVSRARTPLGSRSRSSVPTAPARAPSAALLERAVLPRRSRRSTWASTSRPAP